jgi:hypothetical protein
MGFSFSGTIGMSTNSSTLYFTDNSYLYTLNTTTGAATLVGDTGTVSIGALVTQGGTLYAGVESPLSIDTINTTTALGTLVSNESGETSTFWGLAPIPAAATPEPGYWTLLALGIAGLILVRRRMQVRG